MTENPSDTRRFRVGIISDTHGRLSLAAEKALAGADAIVHAGDIGGPEILQALERIAPVTAVRGNMDYSAWARDLPETDILEMGDTLLFVLHNLQALDLEPGAADIHVVISGHTHLAAADRKNGVLYVNPGSATLPKTDRPATVAMLSIQAGRAEVTFVKID